MPTEKELEQKLGLCFCCQRLPIQRPCRLVCCGNLCHVECVAELKSTSCPLCKKKVAAVQPPPAGSSPPPSVFFKRKEGGCALPFTEEKELARELAVAPIACGQCLQEVAAAEWPLHETFYCPEISVACTACEDPNSTWGHVESCSKYDSAKLVLNKSFTCSYAEASLCNIYMLLRAQVERPFLAQKRGEGVVAERRGVFGPVYIPDSEDFALIVALMALMQFFIKRYPYQFPSARYTMCRPMRYPAKTAACGVAHLNFTFKDIFRYCLEQERYFVILFIVFASPPDFMVYMMEDDGIYVQFCLERFEEVFCPFTEAEGGVRSEAHLKKYFRTMGGLMENCFVKRHLCVDWKPEMLGSIMCLPYSDSRTMIVTSWFRYLQKQELRFQIAYTILLPVIDAGYSSATSILAGFFTFKDFLPQAYLCVLQQGVQPQKLLEATKWLAKAPLIISKIPTHQDELVQKITHEIYFYLMAIFNTHLETTSPPLTKNEFPHFFETWPFTSGTHGLSGSKTPAPATGAAASSSSPSLESIVSEFPSSFGEAEIAVFLRFLLGIFSTSTHAVSPGLLNSRDLHDPGSLVGRGQATPQEDYPQPSAPTAAPPPQKYSGPKRKKLRLAMPPRTALAEKTGRGDARPRLFHHLLDIASALSAQHVQALCLYLYNAIAIALPRFGTMLDHNHERVQRLRQKYLSDPKAADLFYAMHSNMDLGQIIRLAAEDETTPAGKEGGETPTKPEDEENNYLFSSSVILLLWKKILDLEAAHGDNPLFGRLKFFFYFNYVLYTPIRYQTQHLMKLKKLHTYFSNKTELFFVCTMLEYEAMATTPPKHIFLTASRRISAEVASSSDETSPATTDFAALKSQHAAYFRQAEKLQRIRFLHNIQVQLEAAQAHLPSTEPKDTSSRHRFAYPFLVYPGCDAFNTPPQKTSGLFHDLRHTAFVQRWLLHRLVGLQIK